MKLILALAALMLSAPMPTGNLGALPIPWCTPWGPCTPPCAKGMLPIPTCMPGTPCVPWPAPCGKEDVPSEEGIRLDKESGR